MEGRQLEELDIDVEARLKMMKITVFLLLSTYFREMSPLKLSMGR
jgi:hypothetical protein